jgi:hypothetical protein
MGLAELVGKEYPHVELESSPNPLMQEHCKQSSERGGKRQLESATHIFSRFEIFLKTLNVMVKRRCTRIL